MRASHKKLMQIIISVTIICILIYYIDLKQLKEALSSAKPIYLLASIGLIAVNRALMPVKWNLLLRAQNVDIGWIYSIKIYFISSFLGFFLPPTIGADMIRVYYVHRKNIEMPKVLSSIIIERLVGFITLIFFGIIGCVLLANYFVSVDLQVNRVLIILILSFLVFVVLFALSFTEKFNSIVTFIINIIAKIKMLGKAEKLLTKFYSSYKQYRLFKGTLFAFTLLTCLEVTLPIFRSYLVAKALNVNIPLSYFFAFLPVILLLIRLPISFDGFGIQEGGFAYFLSLAGTTATEGFSIGLVNHLIFILGILPGGIFYMTEKIDKKEPAYLKVSAKKKAA